MRQGDLLHDLLDPYSVEAELKKLKKKVRRIQAHNGAYSSQGNGPERPGGPGKPIGGPVPGPDVDGISVTIDGWFTHEGLFMPSALVEVDAQYERQRGFDGYEYRLTSPTGEVLYLLGETTYDGNALTPVPLLIKQASPVDSGESSEEWGVQVRVRNSIYGFSEWSEAVPFSFVPDASAPAADPIVLVGTRAGGIVIEWTAPTEPDYSHTEVWYGPGDFDPDVDGKLLLTTKESQVFVPWDHWAMSMGIVVYGLKIRHVDLTGNKGTPSILFVPDYSDSEATRIPAGDLAMFSIMPSRMNVGVKGYLVNGNLEVKSLEEDFPDQWGQENTGGSVAWQLIFGISNSHVLSLQGDNNTASIVTPFVHWTKSGTWTPGSGKPHLVLEFFENHSALFSGTYTVTARCYDENHNLLTTDVPVYNEDNTAFTPSIGGGTGMWARELAFLNDTDLHEDTRFVRFVLTVTFNIGNTGAIRFDNFSTYDAGSLVFANSVHFRTGTDVYAAEIKGVTGGLSTTANWSVNGNLMVLGTSYLSALEGTSAIFSGSVQIGGGLNVTGTGYFDSDVEISGNLTVSGDATFGYVQVNNPYTGVVSIEVNQPSGFTANMLKFRKNGTDVLWVDSDWAFHGLSQLMFYNEDDEYGDASFGVFNRTGMNGTRFQLLPSDPGIQLYDVRIEYPSGGAQWRNEGRAWATMMGTGGENQFGWGDWYTVFGWAGLWQRYGYIRGAYHSSDNSVGITDTIPLAPLAVGGTEGELVFKDGILVDCTKPTK